MKRNALVRVILWSTVLLVLLGLFFALLYVPGLGFPKKENAAEETWIPIPLTTLPSNESDSNAVTTDTVNIRTKPSGESDIVGMLERGSSLLVTRQESVGGTQWGYVVYPTTGWVAMEYVKLLEPIPQEKTYIDAPSNQIQANAVRTDAASIREIEIEWAAGSIVIQPKDIEDICFMEDGLTRDAEPMVWNVREDKLSIQYSKNTDHSFGMGLVLGKEEHKNLIIQVPFGWQCYSLEIDAASASLEVMDLTIREMEFDGASGSCVFDNCTVEKLDLDTASGNVHFTGSLQQMECDAASADILLELNNVPRSLDLDTASGDLDVTLPADAGFTVTLDTLSGDFESDFDTTMRGSSYVAGDGRCRIDVDAMSGDVTIRRSTK